jgi:hypothetical protein
MQPRRPRTESRFREREVARAVRAAKAAGGERVEIDPTSGKITVIVGKPEALDATAAAVKQWDDATEKLKTEKPKTKAKGR